MKSDETKNDLELAMSELLRHYRIVPNVRKLDWKGILTAKFIHLPKKLKLHPHNSFVSSNHSPSDTTLSLKAIYANNSNGVTLSTTFKILIGFVHTALR